MARPGSKALFLDRDGVINIEKNYVHKVEDFEFIDGIFDLCKRAQQLEFRLFVITNQAGIGRGYYTVSDFEYLTNWMLDRFKEEGINIEKVYYCPFHPTAGIGEFKKDSFDRKPKPGMLLRAQEEFGLDMSSSILIGDKDSDLAAAEAAGVTYKIKLAKDGPPDEGRLIFSSLGAICDWLGTL